MAESASFFTRHLGKKLGGSVVGLVGLTMLPFGPMPLVTQPASASTPLTAKYAYVANGGSGTVSVIDISTNKVVKTVSLGAKASPFGVAVTPNHGYAYVTDSNSVSVINTSTNTVVKTISVGSSPAGVAIT